MQIWPRLGFLPADVEGYAATRPRNREREGIGVGYEQVTNCGHRPHYVPAGTVADFREAMTPEFDAQR